MNKSLYLHIPFCTSICSYCDFCKMKYNPDFVLSYLLALEKEVIEKYNGEVLDTIYIGGGTPSSLTIPELKKLFTILEVLKISKTNEFTFECNIDDIREELLLVLKNNKVNRLSIGIQSFNKTKLKLLNRESNYKDALDKINLCKKMGFNNINADLIYAVPGESTFNLKSDLKKFLSLGVTHISTYSLIIEDNTLLKLNGVNYISDVKDAKMYKLIRKALNKKGFSQYEVSNFSLKGFESKHNTVYWDNSFYYGFGLGASGYYEGVRYVNTRSLTDYISGEFTLERSLLSKKEDMDYELMLGFRKTKGISISRFKEKFNEDIFSVFEINKQIEESNIILEGDYLYINPNKIYVMNEILVKLI